MNAKKEKLYKEIKEHRAEIDRQYMHINDLAKEHIPDFHFLNHRVSTMWRCSDSPIGTCVYNLDARGNITECRFCGGPEWRK